MGEYYNPNLLAGGACRAVAGAPSLEELCAASGIKLAPKTAYRPIDVANVDAGYVRQAVEIGQAVMADLGLLLPFRMAFHDGGLDGFFDASEGRVIHVKTGLDERQLARVLAHELYHADDILNCGLNPAEDRQKLERRATSYAEGFVADYCVRG